MPYVVMPVYLNQMYYNIFEWNCDGSPVEVRLRADSWGASICQNPVLFILPRTVHMLRYCGAKAAYSQPTLNFVDFIVAFA